MLTVREPKWYQHRLLKGPDTNINLHVLPEGCEEINRMLTFRDLLRENRDERKRYETVKIELAARSWEYVQDYADAKTAIIKDILSRASNV
jgi:GrpB-like predicted nucleotidyltransferase (UPF0157 family)